MFGLEEKRGERENDMLSSKENSSKTSRSELKCCQRPGIILNERDSVLWRKSHAPCPIREINLNWSHHSASQVLHGNALPPHIPVEKDKKVCLFAVASGSMSLPHRSGNLRRVYQFAYKPC